MTMVQMTIGSFVLLLLVPMLLANGYVWAAMLVGFPTLGKLLVWGEQLDREERLQVVRVLVDDDRRQ